MDSLRIAGLQMLVDRDIDRNEERILAGIDRARNDEARFLLTPEGSLSGYWAGFDRDKLRFALERVVDHAAEARVGLLLGTCCEEIIDDKPLCFNQVRVYTPEGDYLGFHAKILRCQRLDRPANSEIDEYSDVPLRTFDWHDIRFGALICNDMWATPGFTRIPNPYLPLKLKEMGARVIFHAVNTGSHTPGGLGRPFHETSVALWAKALTIPIVEANVACPDGKPTNARSGLVGPDGSRILPAPDRGEHYFCGEVPL